MQSLCFFFFFSGSFNSLLREKEQLRFGAILELQGICNACFTKLFSSKTNWWVYFFFTFSLILTFQPFHFHPLHFHSSIFDFTECLSSLQQCVSVCNLDFGGSSKILICLVSAKSDQKVVCKIVGSLASVAHSLSK